ncbi:MAG: phosphotransferase [Proteobacteria bacterium]|nr:phosphotransferase [Pseudomonadota bacterium]
MEKQKFDMFFLDMGENIHFHYRDLRIELSVGEFKELAELFKVYSQDVLEEIQAGYNDGVLANTNEAGTLKTFWDKEKKLTFPVKYNEQQLALEETKDGYHLHIRNYKILLRKESFTHLVKAIAPILPLLESDTLKRDPVQLLKENELATKLISRLQTEGHEEIVLEVSDIYRNKAGQVLNAIGYSFDSVQDGKTVYVKDGSIVFLVPPGYALSKISPSDVSTDVSLDLSAFLTRCGHELDAVQLNQLKLKILLLLKMAEKGEIRPFRLQDLYVNRRSLNPAVDLFCRFGDIDPRQEMDSFNKLLGQNKLFMVKPDKKIFSPEKQDQIQDAFFDFVMQKLAPHDCVRKIYILGSSTNRRSGCYQVPFVHFDWAKINSDFDIYIELDPEYENVLPEEWEKKFYWDRAGCDYYHFGDVGDGMASDFAKQYPGIRFYDHLVEGYLFHPLTGNKTKKDKWFSEINARCIFSRDKIAEWLSQNYEITVRDTERFNVASFNKVYHIFSQPEEYVLKVYDSKYLTQKNQKKIVYEIGLLDSLKDSGLEVALPLKNKVGKYISQKDKEQAVLFTLAPGKYVAKPTPEENMLAGNLLARFHNEAKHYKSKYANVYSNKHLLFYWLEAWKEYHDQGGVIGTDIFLDIPYYNKRLRDFKAYPTHCHGDLSIINYLFHDGKCWLIDFQSIGYGPALIDLANGMVEFSTQKRAFHMDNLEFFRQGYESVRKLSRTENDFLTDLLVIQIAVKQAKLLRLHYGGFGYELKEDRILGLRIGLEQLLSR